jgi:selenide, water dikinase
LKKLLLVGAGHAHVEVVRLLGLQKPPNVEITLLSESARAGYSGMMPGVIAGHYSRDEAEVNVPALCARSGVKFEIGVLNRIDAAANTVHTSKADYAYDWLSLNTGSRPWMPENARGLHLGVKPFSAFLDALPQLAAAKTIVVVGGGAAAIEVLFALIRRLGDGHQFALVCASEDILLGYPKKVVDVVKKKLNASGAVLHLNAPVEATEPGRIVLADGKSVACDASVWATGARPHDYVAQSDLAAAADGFIAVNAMQQSISHSNTFAVGDCATLQPKGLPKAGVVPVRQGPWLYQQLCNPAMGKAIVPFQNKPTALALLSLGDKTCVGHKGNFIFHGAWAWWMKDYIDRRFMAKY